MWRMGWLWIAMVGCEEDVPQGVADCTDVLAEVVFVTASGHSPEATCEPSFALGGVSDMSSDEAYRDILRCGPSAVSGIDWASSRALVVWGQFGNDEVLGVDDQGGVLVSTRPHCVEQAPEGWFEVLVVDRATPPSARADCVREVELGCVQ